ncbi:hypothetical protein [Sphingomonas colocasiae]|uniref:Uncharacterized protein n=1 Tax=Sphingomonas colocasiae TaxID=1848973 RepID=A0ABS7PPX6_9SPHN|nr:hypothetical protein [Sphingomonas colocasiae]MBY8823373.1 hypothetical protein [Sphingomonas colocasiae]
MAMNVLLSFIAFFRRGTRGFRLLEETILLEAAIRLGYRRGGKLRERIAWINLVQRLEGGREVNAYAMKRGRPRFDPALRLTDVNGEIAMATFSFRSISGAPFKGTVWLVDGQFVSIEFDKATDRILDEEPVALRVSLWV